MTKNQTKKLVLENGLEMKGIGFGADKPVVGEIIFNTSMVGYQEIISDPAYAGQIVVMTYPPMGQYGIADEDFESRHAAIAGFVAREYCDTPSNFRFTKTLSEELEESGVPAIYGLDTRKLTRLIRNYGIMKAAIVDEAVSTEEALEMIKDFKPATRIVESVSTDQRWFKRTPHHKHDVVIVDLGAKMSLIDCLTDKGCNVTVVPFNSTTEEILGFNPDGVLISSGPGDPAELPEMINTINELKGRLPLAGVGLGHELIAMSYGAKIERLAPGHHGGRPVRDLETGRIEPVEHNHGYAVVASTLPAALKVCYEDVVDKSVEGLKCEKDKVLTSAFYPEGAPGPKEESFFTRLISWME
ncbi:MAG: carbamoyl phosphate synthase small subunit [Bacteroidales bacterium]|nr:carbamoyl phosphate synthase small subunit [Bacteroidales bacterium]